MKLRTVLNGIAALAVVGGLYTFAFCMKDEVNTDSISGKFYETSAETQQTEQTDTVQTEKASIDIFSDAAHNKVLKEKADIPESAEEAQVNKRFDLNPEYEAVTTAPDEVVITPLYVTEAETEAVVTAVPEAMTEEEVTEAQPEEADETAASETTAAEEEFTDHIVAEVTVEAPEAFADAAESEADLLSELDRETTPVTDEAVTDSTDDIERRLEQMQEDIDASTQPTDDSVYDYSDYFETTPAWSETAPSDTALTAFDPEAGEIFTARVDGTVQQFDAYQLVSMIVSTEMSPSFSPEALKAQAVAAYSYVKYHNVNGLVPTVLVKRDIPQEVTDAVNAVWGKCCYYNGKVAQTVYTASSAGTTASAVNVWGGADVPYLTSVATPFDAQSDLNYGVITVFTEDQIRTALESSLGITLSEDPANWLTVTSRVDGNYVSGLNVDNQLTISGMRLREKVLKYSIKSWCFDVSYADGEFTFITYGYGHGVGMSQNGANILGKQGYTYDQILAYYFPGITIE